MNASRITRTVVFGLTSLAFTLSAPLALAAKFKIDGGFVTLRSDRAIKLSQESGRYPNLGRNYYRTASIGCKSVINTSKKGISGQLSLEYWAMPYIDSTTGTPLMSVLLPPVKAGKRINDISKDAQAGYYNANGYIQLRLYEYSGGVWLLRSSKSVGSRQLL